MQRCRCDFVFKTRSFCRARVKMIFCSDRRVFVSSLVPFDEDEKDPSVWFLDHDYLENMSGMFKKVNGMC